MKSLFSKLVLAAAVFLIMLLKDTVKAFDDFKNKKKVDKVMFFEM